MSLVERLTKEVVQDVERFLKTVFCMMWGYVHGVPNWCSFFLNASGNAKNGVKKKSMETDCF